VVEAYGGKVTGSVSSNTLTYRRKRPAPSWTAQKLGVPVIDEAELRRMVGKS